MRWRVVALVFLAAFSCVQQRPETVDTAAARIAGRVWSPYCAGRILTECPTTQAHELRDRIAERLESGQSEEQVLAWLAENYGPEVLAAPESDRAGVIVWIVPAAILAAGLVIAGGFAWSWSRRPESAAPPPGPGGPSGDLEPWIARVREEVDRRGRTG